MLCGQRTTDEMRASLIYLGPMGNIINCYKHYKLYKQKSEYREYNVG